MKCVYSNTLIVDRDNFLWCIPARTLINAKEHWQNDVCLISNHKDVQQSESFKSLLHDIVSSVMRWKNLPLQLSGRTLKTVRRHTFVQITIVTWPVRLMVALQNFKYASGMGDEAVFDEWLKIFLRRVFRDITRKMIDSDVERKSCSNLANVFSIKGKAIRRSFISLMKWKGNVSTKISCIRNWYLTLKYDGNFGPSERDRGSGNKSGKSSRRTYPEIRIATGV